MTQSGPYARGLRAVALVVAAATLARHYTMGPTSPDAERTLLCLRVTNAVLAVVVALLASPHRPIAHIRRLALALGLGTTLASLAVVMVTPGALWEETAVVAAMMLGAALFIPWSVRWQAGFAAVVLPAAAATTLLVAQREALALGDALRVILTLLAIGLASVAGAYLADWERQRVTTSEARYRGLFQAAGDAIVVFDAGGVIRQANARFAELVERRVDEVLGRPLEDYYFGVARDDRTLALSGALRSATRTLRRADGRPVEVEITFARADGPGGPAVQAILRDLTDRRAAERRAVQQQRLDALARLAGGIAHRFNNLLGGILTHASLLRQTASSPEAVTQLDEIVDAARGGRDLTKELLRFTRHEALTLRPTRPDELLHSVAQLARAILPDTTTIDVEAPDSLPAVSADSDHLVHACLELVENARDAMKGRAQGRLLLSAQAETVAEGDQRWPGATPGRYVRLSVSDTGVGMDPSTLERVFEPFFTTKPMHGAAGLGLALVYGIARDHRGSLRIESTPGRGTSVDLLIPVSTEAPKPAPAPAPAAPAAPAVPPAGQPDDRTILVVDDEAIVRSSLRRALTRFGFRVLEAEDGPTALAALQSANPPIDLVILDLVLPGGGAAIFEMLKAVRPGLRVLVSSGYSPEEETSKALAARADGFLPKPYEITELRAAVSRALGR